MYCSFDRLPDNSRLWIFKSKDKLSTSTIEELESELPQFLGNWKAHNQDLMSGFKIMDHHFLLIGVDQSYENPSGCSIDELFCFIRNLGSKHSLAFSDNSLIAYRENTEIHFADLQEMKSRIKQNHIPLNTTIFNSTLSSKGAIEREWEIPIRQSWLKKYIYSIQYENRRIEP